MTDHFLTGPLEMVRGVIGREPTGADRFIFEFDDVRNRDVHMVGVRNPLRVTWLANGVVTREETLRPWTGFASADADRVIEEPADAQSLPNGSRVTPLHLSMAGSIFAALGMAVIAATRAPNIWAFPLAVAVAAGWVVSVWQTPPDQPQASEVNR